MANATPRLQPVTPQRMAEFQADWNRRNPPPTLTKRLGSAVRQGWPLMATCLGGFWLYWSNR